MQFNVAQQEIVLKVVYFGPPRSGKATNLKQVHDLLDPPSCGRLTTFKAGADETLFFDLVPIAFSGQPGFRIKIKLFTVPGQVAHAATRRIVLAGADGVIFVADSQRSAAHANRDYWDGMQAYLRETGLDPTTLPIVIQFNKRDVPDARTDKELLALQAEGSAPIFPAVAVRGEGVLETLRALLEQLFTQLEKRYSFQAKFNVSGEDFLASVFGHAMGIS